jgi:Serine carboxypeptidase
VCFFFFFFFSSRTLNTTGTRAVDISSLSGPINEYNVAETCAPDLPLCYNFTGSADYLNRADVQAAIGVDRKWEVCTGVVHQELAGDWFNSQQYMVPDILEAGVRVYGLFVFSSLSLLR